ncbi:MAG: MerR family DNA-binding transcriptional regulator [Acidimicrobiales bacterium]
MSDRAHLSIGEVLNLLQDEFPDITISKIRFLESQGLLDPERTPSGYRKFYDADIERLRWILRQQRENFLPLKVIKDRLDEGDIPELAEAPADPSPAPEAPADPSPAPEAVASANVDATPAPSPPRPAPAPIEEPAHAAPADEHEPLDPGETSVSLTVDELARASGLTARQLGELERYGLLHGEQAGTTTYYDEHGLLVARTAASFLAHGVEPRHLRMYKVAAEREASFYEQLVLPLAKQRKANARRQARQTLGDLAKLGDTLHKALLRDALRDHLGG